MDNNGFLDVRWHFREMLEPLFVYFSKYISNMYPLLRQYPLINASIILKKEEYEYSTFPNKVRHHKVQHRDQQQRFRHTAPHD